MSSKDLNPGLVPGFIKLTYQASMVTIYWMISQPIPPSIINLNNEK